MKIKTKLLISLLFSGLPIIAFGIVLFFTIQESNEAEQEENISRETVKGVFELNLLMSDYLLHREQRAADQWQLKHQGIETLLIAAEFNAPTEALLLANLREDHENIRNIFSRFLEGSVISDQLEERLVGQLLVRSQSMVTNAVELSEHSRATAAIVQQRAIWFVIVFIGILLAVIIANALLIFRSILQPITRLQEATEIISAGKLHFEMVTDSRDEIGQLSKAFSTMTQTLRTTIEKLEQEVVERRRAEEGIAKKAEELARSNADLEQFAYVASHDLQEPLRKVASYTELLAKRYQSQLDEKADLFINYIVDGAMRMQGLIKDLLTYSRVGTQGKEFERTDCNRVIEEVVSSLHFTIRENDAQIDSDPMPTVLADPSQLVQLFQNLVSNAIKYRREASPKVHIGARKKDDEWQFFVRDNGIGIESQYSARVFVIFQRLHNREEYSGTGIGLAICKKIVERHGGRIWFESEPGTGTTFFFTIPTRGNN